VGGRRKEYDALSVRETSADVPANSAVEKLLVLVELDDVIARRGVHHHLIPGLTVHHRRLRNRRL
jgi:hypothetical protein